MNANTQFVPYFAESASCVFWGWILYRKFVSPKPLSSTLRVAGKLVKLCLVLITCGLLAGCSNPDPLAVASGPVFALNAGHWQPTPRDLAAPPKVSDR
ncbi:type IV secretion system lipoprotein VirB7 [Acidocella facilis]|uniref:type IV secretion system lipoprotein VirB7 n=1 Tax=Acidocella facilis TaxID=525 RepID=UPI0038D19CFF